MLSPRSNADRSGEPDPVIRTPDRRLRVFVSSKLGELAAERRAVARTISALRLTPVMFELGARPHPPREVYRAYLAQSDVFVGLYWQRYGQLGPGAHAQLAVDGRDMCLDGPHADEQCGRGVPVGCARRDQVGDPPLGGGQLAA